MSGPKTYFPTPKVEFEPRQTTTVKVYYEGVEQESYLLHKAPRAAFAEGMEHLRFKARHQTLAQGLWEVRTAGGLTGSIKVD